MRGVQGKRELGRLPRSGWILTGFLSFFPRFIRIGGYKLLNTWLTSSKASNNVPFLQQILLTLQHLPLTVDHLKQVGVASVS